MALDGVLINGLTIELYERIANGKIEKIYQPEKDEVHILIRNHGENYRLLLSASANHPRVHLTNIQKINPITPPMFCMVLRKHLTNSRVTSISQHDFERIIEITFETLNELGDIVDKRLIIEVMGRHSNIIFVDHHNRIIDSIKHINENISRVREVLPGKDYQLPPSQGKTNPKWAEGEQLKDLFESDMMNTKSDRLISNAYTGISRTTGEEIVYRALALSDTMQTKTSTDQLVTAFLSFFKQVNAGLFRATILHDESGKPKDILPFPYTQFDPSKLYSYPSFSEALDAFYSGRDMVERIQQRTAHLSKVIKTNQERCEKKLALQYEEITQAEKAENYRLCGELITANIYNIPQGLKEVSLYNYYDPDGTNIVISLDPSKTPGQNAQSYYKKYTKAKTAFVKYQKMVQDTKDEMTYLESLLEHLSKSTSEAEMMEIREELVKEGYIKGSQGKDKRKQKKGPSPHLYISSEGFEMYVGKNNLQNDYLTLKLASGNDIWLHTKGMPGSHVIIKTIGREVHETTLMQAANLAAYYSKGRYSSKVPVDYCPKKNVKKPGGAKPGMVIYDHYNTIYVTPTEEEISKLHKRS